MNRRNRAIAIVADAPSGFMGNGMVGVGVCGPKFHDPALWPLLADGLESGRPGRRGAYLLCEGLVKDLDETRALFRELGQIGSVDSGICDGMGDLERTGDDDA